MCDAGKDWHERSFRASGAINGCQKYPLDEPEITFSFFIFGPPVAYYLQAFFIFLTHNSILFCLLEYNSSIFVGSCLNLSEVRQCRMQVCPAYRDQAVFRCFFYEYSTFLHTKFYICLRSIAFTKHSKKPAGYIWI